MRFRVFGDLMGKVDQTNKIISDEFKEVEFLIFTGDIPNPEVFKNLREQKVLEGEQSEEQLKDVIESDELLKEIAAQVANINELFGEMRKEYEIYSVLGNADLRKFLSTIPIEETLNIIHKKAIKINDYILIGYNGRPIYQFEKENKDENAFSEEEIYQDLFELFTYHKDDKVILVTHAPPYKILDQVKSKYLDYAIGTYGERAKDGHIGSVGLRRIVDKFNPILHIFGHIHECKGVHVSQNTTFVNAGSLGDDGGFLDISLNDEIDVVFYQVN